MSYDPYEQQQQQQYYPEYQYQYQYASGGTSFSTYMWWLFMVVFLLAAIAGAAIYLHKQRVIKLPKQVLDVYDQLPALPDLNNLPGVDTLKDKAFGRSVWKGWNRIAKVSFGCLAVADIVFFAGYSPAGRRARWVFGLLYLVAAVLLGYIAFYQNTGLERTLFYIWGGATAVLFALRAILTYSRGRRRPPPPPMKEQGLVKAALPEAGETLSATRLFSTTKKVDKRLVNWVSKADRTFNANVNFVKGQIGAIVKGKAKEKLLAEAEKKLQDFKNAKEELDGLMAREFQSVEDKEAAEGEVRKKITETLEKIRREFDVWHLKNVVQRDQRKAHEYAAKMKEERKVAQMQAFPPLP